MRTPVIVVSGQGDTDAIRAALLRRPGSVAVDHRFDGQVVVRSVTIDRDGVCDVSRWPLELVSGCVGSTVRRDLLVLLRRLHRRSDVERIVVVLQQWLEPEPLCWAIRHVAVRVGPGYIDGPAARDVRIEAVVTGVDTRAWLPQALGDDELDEHRTMAQVVVDQAEYADVLVLDAAEPAAVAVLRRLAPLSRITVGTDRLELALAHLEPGSRRGADHDPHTPLLAGEPPLHPDGATRLIEFGSRRPFHPHRLHLAIDDLLDGVVRIRGRAWLASQPDAVVWVESAGGGLRIGHEGNWLASMTAAERAAADPQRVALAAARWDDRFGDRHVAMTALLHGADPATITAALHRALLTDDELDHPERWARFTDPFGEWHEDPCGDRAPDSVADDHHRGGLA